MLIVQGSFKKQTSKNVVGTTFKQTVIGKQVKFTYIAKPAISNIETSLKLLILKTILLNTGSGIPELESQVKKSELQIMTS